MAGRSSGSRRRRAVVTGGAGFIGSHLVDRLIAEGASVLVIDDLSVGDASAVDRSARLEVLDIARDDLGPVIGRFRPSVVYHLAAQASVPRSARDPLRDLAVNVGGTARVLEASRGRGGRSPGVRVVGRCRLRRAGSRGHRADLPGTCLVLPAQARRRGARRARRPALRHRPPSNVYGPRQRAGLAERSSPPSWSGRHGPARWRSTATAARPATSSTCATRSRRSCSSP